MLNQALSGGPSELTNLQKPIQRLRQRKPLAEVRKTLHLMGEVVVRDNPEALAQSRNNINKASFQLTIDEIWIEVMLLYKLIY